MGNCENFDTAETDSVPSLEIVRDILDLPKDFNRLVQTGLKDLRILDKRDVEVYLEPSSCMKLVTFDEILNLHDVVVKEPTDEAMFDLAEYLECELPDTFDETVLFNIGELDEKNESMPGYGGKSIHYSLVRSRFNKRLKTERNIAKNTLYNYFGIDASSESMRGVWTSRNIGRILIAKVVGRPNIVKVGDMLSDLVPNDVTLGMATIEEI